MIKKLLAIILLFLSSPILAQEKIGKLFGGAKLDRGIFIDKTSDNALLIVGFTESFSASNDMYVIKTTVDGSKIWERNIGGDGSDVAWSFIEVDGGAAYLITGFSDSYGSGEDIMLVKIAKDGNVLWQKNLPSPGNERCWSFSKISDGNFIVIGQTQDRVTKNYDGLITKIDAEGSIIWQKSYGGLEYNRLFYCNETSTGELIVTGITRTDSLADNSGWILRIDHQGNQLASLSLNTIRNTTVHGILPVSKNKILIYGYAQADTAKNQRSIYFALVNDKGALLSEKLTDERTSINHGLTAIVTPADKILMTGYTKPLSGGKWNGVIYAFNKRNRKLIFKKEFGGENVDQPYTITQVGPDKFAITGVTYNFGAENGDLWFVTINSQGEVLK